jgi:purine-cytosine permease-like protein
MAFGLNRATGKLEIGPAKIPMPVSRGGRIAVAIALMAGGLLGFLPILGFWMLPLGFILLSNELHVVRRMRRRLGIWWSRRRQPA